MKTYPHRVMVTEAPPESPAAALGYLADPAELTVAHFVPVPGHRKPAGLAFDLLEQLGKDCNVTGKPRHSTEERELVTLWLTAHRTQLLTVGPTQQTDPRDLLALVQMLAPTPTNVLFAVDNGNLFTLRAALQPAAPVYVPWPNLPTIHPSEINATITLGGFNIHREPVLPNVEYWTWLATTKRLLTDDEYAPIHRLYVDTLNRTLNWLQQHDQTGTQITVDGAHTVLKATIEEQATFDQVTTVVRATQAAYHRHGWYLNVDERELRAGLVRFPTHRTDPTIYRRLRAYRSPHRAACTALYLAGATPNAIHATTVGDLSQWRTDPTRPVAGVSVPTDAAPYLRALLLTNAYDGNTATQPAFPGASRRIKDDIRQAATDLTLNLGDAKLQDDEHPTDRRTPKRAITLEALT